MAKSVRRASLEAFLAALVGLMNHLSWLHAIRVYEGCLLSWTQMSSRRCFSVTQAGWQASLIEDPPESRIFRKGQETCTCAFIIWDRELQTLEPAYAEGSEPDNQPTFCSAKSQRLHPLVAQEEAALQAAATLLH
jgi:hypothetical protein